MSEICGAKLRGTHSKHKDGLCHNAPVPGAKRCRRHGGSAPQVKRTAANRLALQQLEEDMVMLGIRETYETADPAAQMLHVLGVTAAEERYLASRVADLSDEKVLRWTRTDHRTGSGPEGPIDVETFSAVPDVLIAQLRECRDRLIRYAAMCVKANIDERRMALAESQADQLVGSFLRALAAVVLTDAQREELQAAFVRELRSLEAGQVAA